MSRLDNKLIAVIGGAGLLGSTFVDSIIENGGRCIIAEINETAGVELQKKYGEEKVLLRQIDITSADSITEFLNYFESKGERIEAVVNTAYPKTSDFNKDFFEVEYETLCKNLNMHLAGYFLLSQKFAEYFSKLGGGNIINITSIYGHVAPRFEIYRDTQMSNGPEYAMIKSGIIHLTRFMAQRFSGMNIRVNCVSPGGIRDGQPEAFLNNYKELCSNKGMLDPKDIAGTITFLLSDESKFIQGQAIVVDDGFSL